MMTEDEGDIAHERYLGIAAAIDALVNKMTADMTPEQDVYIRNLLNDTQRYWRDNV